MSKDFEMVREFYDQGAEYEWARLEQHPFEFLLTTWMMDQYIRPGDSVLDIGGGPGRYSIYFAEKDCTVTLAELSGGNVELARKKAAEAGVALTAHAVNCLELETLELGQFDHVFLMGPLYHLLEEEDRVRAVEIALRHLKPGGKLYVSFILLFANIIYYLQNGGALVEEWENPAAAAVKDAVASGRDWGGPAFTTAYFYHQRNILSFMECFGLEKLHFFGQEGILAPNYREILKRDPAEIERWVELAKKYIEVPELLAYSEHAMYIGRKGESR
ncbi:MAG: class I SAM-dependent methyltransferase [Oscillospiraceae bacterium]|nr:class I SAM-dependent methyltransferase [Oscillospiraceae bacterium]